MSKDRKDTFMVRKGLQTDLSQIKALVEACYGKNCSDYALYSETETWKKIVNNEEVLYVGVDLEGRILGIEVCGIKTPFQNTVYLKTKMTLPEKRNQGIGGKITKFMMQDFDFSPFVSAYAFALTYNSISQEILAGYGFQPSGFLYNSYLRCAGRPAVAKRSHVIMIKNFKKQGIDLLYVPREVWPFVEEVYRSFGAEIRIKGEIKKPAALYSNIVYHTDTHHQNTEIIVKTIGKDFGDRIRYIKQNSSLMPLGTLNLFLNMRDQGTVWGYECLKELGFVVSGMKPFGRGEEFLVLYASEEVAVQLNTMVIREQYGWMKEKLKLFLEGGKKVGTFQKNKK